MITFAEAKEIVRAAEEADCRITNSQRSPIQSGGPGIAILLHRTSGRNPMTQHEPASVVGSLANKQATSDSRSHMPTWMIIAGVIISIVGAIIMGVASNKKDQAEDIEDFTVAFGGLPGSPAIDAATTWGYIGLGVLIFGAALLLVGLAVAAVRR
jgi:hypothetical protein